MPQPVRVVRALLLAFVCTLVGCLLNAFVLGLPNEDSRFVLFRVVNGLWLLWVLVTVRHAFYQLPGRKIRHLHLSPPKTARPHRISLKSEVS